MAECCEERVTSGCRGCPGGLLAGGDRRLLAGVRNYEQARRHHGQCECPRGKLYRSRSGGLTIDKSGMKACEVRFPYPPGV